MLSTIINKLERPTLDGKKDNTIQLTRMQDVGGCRAIVDNLSQLNELHSRLEDSRSVHQIVGTNNYLKPKNSGYSGIHLVYSCFLGSNENNEWKKTKIEVQLRTDLQHAWATSLEIIDTIDGINLKTSMDGHPEWRRFFQIAGQLVAHVEKCCVIPEDELPSIVEELCQLEKELGVRKKLFHYNLAIKTTTDTKRLPRRVLAHQGLFLVRMFRASNEEKAQEKAVIRLQVKAFGPKHTDEALSELAKNEADPTVLVSVLVSAGDVRNLKKAYPNYFGSTTKFQNFLSGFVEPKEKSSANIALHRTSR